ncbi:MAG: hypothetical protein IJJ29_02130 [Solobacterium sp.]|nr:hypothetical protein [Solobacterium sp.]
MRKGTKRLYAAVFLVILFGFGGITLFNMWQRHHAGTAVNEQKDENISAFENDYNAVFAGKERLVDINGAAASAAGAEEMNGVIKLRNGQLTELHEKVSEETLAKEAENVKVLASFLEAQGIPFLYVSAPDKVSMYDDQLPEGVQDFSNENIDTFLHMLDERGVEYLDLREVLHDVDPDLYRFFYRTDHHWTTEAGFYAYCGICAKIQELSGISVDPKYTDINNYREDTYPGVLLGTWGQRTGEAFAGEPDDFSFICPGFETDVIRKYDWHEGTLEENFYYPDLINTDEPGLFYDLVLATVTDARNMSLHNGKRIMFLGDSFSRTVNPFFMISYEYFDYENCYNSSSLTAEMITETKPDIVVLMHSPWNNYGREESFQYDLK